MKTLHFLLVTSLLVLFVHLSYGETAYFLVANQDDIESYVLPLTDPNDIDHARDLIQFGPSIGQSIVTANVACGSDGINRNYIVSTKHAWNWHVTGFVEFSDLTIEILDGRPSDLLKDCDSWITEKVGLIGFWSYTVVEELGTDPKHWQCDFDHDNKVNMNDFLLLGHAWMRSDCLSPGWCSGTDLNQDHFVDEMDLILYTDAWLSPYTSWPTWFDAWDCPTQCHGDANCESESAGLFKPMCPVGQSDQAILTSTMPLPVYYGDGTGRYDPRVDFDRDGDIDDVDTTILEYWMGVEEDDFPIDCPIAR